MKRLGSMLAVLAVLLPAGSAAGEEARKSVAVTSIVEHPALDAVRDGVRDVLAEEGLVAGESLDWTFETAQGNPATAAQIARSYVSDRPDVIVAIATPSAQAVVSATSEIPVVFSAVTDPVGARLVPSLEAPGGNVTGISDLSPVKKHLAMVKEITPGTKRLGFLYNPGEANSVTLLELARRFAPEFDLEIVEAAAPRSSDVLAAAQSLVGKADGFYVPTDNTIVSALEAVVKIGRENRVPVFAGDTESVKRGAMAALGFDYYDVGRQTGEVVMRILSGAEPGSIDVETIQKTELHVNRAAAEAMGVELPDAVLERAAKVIE